MTYDEHYLQKRCGIYNFDVVLRCTSITTISAFRCAMTFFIAIKTWWTAYTRMNATIRELSSLSNYELNDIGICRGDIVTIAHAEYKKNIFRLSYNPAKHYMRGSTKNA